MTPMDTRLTETVVAITEAASKAGIPDTQQAFVLMLSALAIADRNCQRGCSRDSFMKMAGCVYDKLRGSLGGGVRT